MLCVDGVRLQSELMSLMMASPEGISAFPASDSDLTKWKGRLQGAEVSYSTSINIIFLLR